ncbi:hypothetical protein HGM15179_007709 [Zosterops borbonicus]|uniref:Armadillo repeat-containing protein 1 n=1 Tax=Zosterops borbonicus TaxID=364589 RepID=A0A8K1LMT5_9PASS|nr:hypothetical protein HGM15179_007709 [Zosterops borbonicus]
MNSAMSEEPDALSVVNQLRDLAADPLNRRAIVQDQGCLPGLILFLDHPNPQVVHSALLALRYLAECRVNREKMKSELGMMLSLQNVIQKTTTPGETKLLASEVYDILQSSNMSDMDNVNEMNYRRRKAQFFLGSTNKRAKTVVLHIDGLDDSSRRNLCEEALLKIKGVISFTFQMAVQRCVVRIRSDLKAEALATAIASTKVMKAQQVVKSESGEEMLVPFQDTPVEVEQNTDLPEYLPEDESPTKEQDKAVSRVGSHPEEASLVQLSPDLWCSLPAFEKRLKSLGVGKEGTGRTYEYDCMGFAPAQAGVWKQACFTHDPCNNKANNKEYLSSAEFLVPAIHGKNCYTSGYNFISGTCRKAVEKFFIVDSNFCLVIPGLCTRLYLCDLGKSSMFHPLALSWANEGISPHSGKNPIHLSGLKWLVTVLLSPGEAHMECCAQFWAPQYKRNTELLEQVLQKWATKMIKGLEHLSYEERLKGLGLFSLGRKSQQKEVLISVYSCLNGECQEDLGSWWCQAIGRDAMGRNGCTENSTGILGISLPCELMKNPVFVLIVSQTGKQSKMIGPSSLLDSKKNITENFFALMQEENKAFEQKTKIPSVISTHY